MPVVGHLKEIIDQLKEYIETKIELTKLKAVDKSAEIVSDITMLTSTILVALLSVIILSVGFSLWIGQLLGSYAYGFLITGAIYSIILIIVCVQRKNWIKKPVTDKMIVKFLK